MSTEKLKLGIIGAGNRGIKCFGRLFSQREDVVITCVCDPNHIRAEAAISDLTGEQACYTTTEAMFEKETLDAAVITSPDCYHSENAVDALNHGAHVLIDKPLATTVKGCKAIINAAEKAGKTVMIGFNLRHTSTLKRLKSIIDDGVLGEVFLIENREFYNGGRTYMSRWNRFYDKSGGLWIHKGSHDFDVFNWLLGFPRPERVSATAGVNALKPEKIPFEVKPGTQVGPTCTDCSYASICPDRYEVEGAEWSKEAQEVDNYAKNTCMYISEKSVHDNGIAIVEYENGIRASHMECFVSSFTDRLYTVVGDKGQAEVSLHDRSIVVRPRWSSEIIRYEIPPAQGGHGGSDPGLSDTFINVIKGDAGNTSTAEHGMWSTAIGQAAELSWREGRMVAIDELMKDDG